MSGSLITVLSFAFVLGVLVFVHELGHFLAAKRIGIKVLKFQLGFNPTVLSFRRGDTEYSIGALPLGGYVKMAGENPDEPSTGGPEEFMSRSKWERFQVLIMGPVMNLGLAVILTAVVLYQGAERLAYETRPVVLGAVTPDSPAAGAGLKPGDHITAVAGKDVATWEDFYIAVGTKPDRQVQVSYVRDGSTGTVEVTPKSPAGSRFEIGDIGVLPDVHPHIRTVNPGDPADKAGMKANDVVVSVNGESIIFSSNLKDAISKRPEQQLTINILRDGQPMTILATPKRTGSTGLLGVAIGDETSSIKPGALGAARMAVEKNVQYAGLIFQTVWGLITAQTSPKQLMGPVAIAQLSGESAQLGWIALFSLMAQISLNLGLLNLMPIPVLDGGHIFIMAMEGVARRDFSTRMKEKMLLAGFVVLMTLMVTVIYNDLTRISWIERLMPWR
ncbi:MAG TPA: RIP metalloprotease RseP [Vicinamibacterales bacterium]|nr:RIP metalloprotease RseP [Vicinamibacterales bacterium]